MFDFLFKPRSIYSLASLTFLLTVFFLLFILPVNFNLLGYQNGTGDLSQHLSGWYAFVQEPWHFPLLRITSLNYPNGASLSQMDGVPLWAIPFKLVHRMLPPNFNYFGIFLLFVYFFQSFAALTLTYALNKTNLFTTFLLVLFSLTLPILNIRVGTEDSLAAQGFILLGLAGYFFTVNQKLNLYRCHLYYGILIATSLLIHPYLTAMFYPFYMISLIRIRKDKTLKWKTLIKPFLIMHSLILLEYFILGLNQQANACGFGYFSMNLLSSVTGGLINHYQNSIAYPGQSEGFAYLGLGLITMILIAFVLRLKTFKLFCKEYKALFIVMVVFFIYSIYSNIYFGTHKVLVYGVPHFFLTCMFRTNGRFFWPITYTLLAFALITILNKIPKKAIWLLPVLLIIQIVDVSGYLNTTKAVLKSNFTPMHLADPYASQILGLIHQNQIIIFYPKTGCSMSDADFKTFLQVELLTAQAGALLNTAYLAHYKTTLCTDDARQFPNKNPKLLVSTITNPSPTILKLLQQKPNPCKIIDNTYYCEYKL